MGGSRSGLKWVAVVALTIAASSPLMAGENAGGFTPVHFVPGAKLTNPGSPIIQVETAGCSCGGIAFQAACPGGKKVACHCNPPGFKCK